MILILGKQVIEDVENINNLIRAESQSSQYDQELYDIVIK